MFVQVLREAAKQGWGIVDEAQDLVAAAAEKFPNGTSLVIMVNRQRTLFVVTATYVTPIALGVQHGVVICGVDAVA